MTTGEKLLRCYYWMTSGRSKEFSQLRNIKCFIDSAQLHEFASFGVEPKRLLALTMECVIFLHIVNCLITEAFIVFFVSPDPVNKLRNLV